MQLSEYLRKDFIVANLAARDKPAALAELVAPVAAAFPEVDRALAQRVLMDREALGSTGIGDGVAIPHGKMELLQEIVIVVGRSEAGLDFEALDHKPCHIFFLVLAPERVAGMHLRILAQISRLLSSEAFREAFLAADTRERLWDVLQSHA